MRQDAPNVLIIIADDHAAHAISAYGSRINQTPGIDRLAREGMRLDACFCTNSLCSPSRAAILTGTYNHVNGVTSNSSGFDARQTTFASLMQAAGYQTAMIGKWHLGHGGVHDPRGFDRWIVLPDQGTYHDPELLHSGGLANFEGAYVTDLLSELTIEWLDERDRSRPFCAIVGHKAPHEAWEPAPRHEQLFTDVEIAEPPTLRDDHLGRATPAREATMSIVDDMPEENFKVAVPEGLSGDERLVWKYQRYIKDYLRTVASLDESVARLLSYLDEDGSVEDTVVIYTSDQGFFLGDHGWYDKRFMYEESLKMPMLVRYPREVEAGTTCDDIVLNVDFAPTLLDLAGLEVPDEMQGRSFREVLGGRTPEDWRRSMYYRYWVHQDVMHNVWSHYGVRTDRYKLIYFYAEPCGVSGAREPSRQPEWELFDLERDPQELRNVFDDPSYTSVRDELIRELGRLQDEVGDVDCAPLPDPVQLGGR